MKNVPKPDTIDIHTQDSSAFNAWYDLFVAYSCTHDAKWEKLLKAAEDSGKDQIDKVKLSAIGTALGITDEGMNKVLQFLYLNLLQFTKGESHSRVVAGGMTGSMETYRQLVLRGRNATVTSLMDQRMKGIQLEKAKTIDEVEM